MATHSNILGWENPWTEKSDGLQSVRSQKSWTQLSNKTTMIYVYIYILLFYSFSLQHITRLLNIVHCAIW